MSLSLPTNIDDIDYLKWESFEPFYAELQARPLSAETQQQWLEDWSHLTKLVFEAMAYTRIQRTLDTLDPKREAAFFTIVGEVAPKMQVADQQLKARLLGLEIDDPDMQIMMRNVRSAFELFREENLPIQTEITKLTANYDSVVGGFSAEVDGETQNLSMLATGLNSSDRSERETTWRTIMDLWQSGRSEMNDIYVKMLDLREQVSTNAGYDNHRDYAFVSRGRFAYSPEECYQFHDAIEAAFVPAATRILERKKAEMGVDVLRPWDYVPEMSMIVDTSPDGPLKPFETEDELIRTGLSIFNALDADLGHRFATMADDGLLDLMTRPGKAAGGYCSGLPLRRRPFIFMNSTGSARNVNTLLHEAGHAFHGFEAMDKQPLVWMLRAPMEFNEVAAMSMELLASPYLTKDKGGFYSSAEADQHRQAHLEKIILFMPFMAVVDSFQHWVYTNVEQARDAASLDAKWDELWQRFLPQVDWTGFEHVRASGWHRKLHIFRYPFYYIEYGMAQIGALQIWRNSLDDHALALKNYRNALALGGTRDLATLFAAAGAEFRFDTPFIADLVALIESHMA